MSVLADTSQLGEARIKALAHVEGEIRLVKTEKVEQEDQWGFQLQRCGCAFSIFLLAEHQSEKQFSAHTGGRYDPQARSQSLLVATGQSKFQVVLVIDQHNPPPFCIEQVTAVQADIRIFK